MHLVLIVVKTQGIPLPEPIFQWQRDLAEVLLSEHVVPVPDDNLDRAKPICEGEKNGKVERGILEGELRICSALDDRGVVPRIQQGDDDEARKE